MKVYTKKEETTSAVPSAPALAIPKKSIPKKRKI